MEEPTYDEIELIKEGYCEACKGMFFMHETECYEECEGFADELKEIRGEADDSANVEHDWPCQHLHGGRGTAIYSNVNGRCQHPECHPSNGGERECKKHQLVS